MLTALATEGDSDVIPAADGRLFVTIFLLMLHITWYVCFIQCFIIEYMVHVNLSHQTFFVGQWL